MHTLQNLFYSFQTANHSRTPLTEEAHNNYKFIRGNLVLTGRQPDGDSVAFIANNIDLFQDVYRSYLLDPSSRDGSVQLRFEGIDAPELHYGSSFQPLSVESRDYLLKEIFGFEDITYSDANSTSHPAFSVNGSRPAMRSATIATNALETHGRPIAYVFLDEDFEDGATGPLTTGQIERTVNYEMLAYGHAYLLAYTSMPVAHYQVFKQAANNARSARLGVWKQDTTKDFVLANAGSIAGSQAQMIYPKLFRRCVDFLKSGEPDMKEWLRSRETENDGVRITESTTVSLSSLIHQVNDHIYFRADTNDIIFVEK